eukprot:3190285-Pyramimonas_sp.AAC.1
MQIQWPAAAPACKPRAPDRWAIVLGPTSSNLWRAMFAGWRPNAIAPSRAKTTCDRSPQVIPILRQAVLSGPGRGDAAAKTLGRNLA